MKFTIVADSCTLVLSRRNLESLLAKLDGYPQESARTVFKTNEEGQILVVHAEPDDVHYGSRGYGPGPMHPNTEERIQKGES